ncbi:hypothetical protein CNECB9_4870032 [Cupriavidus necator]|uniref:Uncharacterized protein n=1 Tax=Cupriavidus necator TaxID=106590 RepID=A0A1K0JUL2_CUPNE|nr:hypothetical protein CNECB9_4870032 [Cupriavidus necator]
MPSSSADWIAMLSFSAISAARRRRTSRYSTKIHASRHGVSRQSSPVVQPSSCQCACGFACGGGPMSAGVRIPGGGAGCRAGASGKATGMPARDGAAAGAGAGSAVRWVPAQTNTLTSSRAALASRQARVKRCGQAVADGDALWMGGRMDKRGRQNSVKRGNHRCAVGVAVAG